MAAGTIISVLSNIPWGQVVDNAPKVADGAARLWKVVTRKKPDASPDANADAVAQPAQSEAELFTNRLAAMEAHILRLEEQLGASAELIKALAEQNTQLVQQTQRNSVRLSRLATVTALGALALVGTVVYLL